MKHVVITGGTRGIGYGIAKEFLKNGCKVTINGTTEIGVQNAVESLKNETNSNSVYGVVGDVRSQQDMQNLWNLAKSQFGDIHIWLNNAGIPQPREMFWEIDESSIQNSVHINILGVMNGSQVAMREMIKQGHGFIYNMEGFGSDGMTMVRMTLYGTTKRALQYFTHSLAKEAKNTPVKVGVVSPGTMVITDFVRQSLPENSQERKQLIKIFNILADHVEPVAIYLVGKMLTNTKNDVKFKWLTREKVLWRFLTAPFVKRRIMEED